MDELSWRAKLAKLNINITGVDLEHNILFYDFAYRPFSGATPKWVKTTTTPIIDTYKAINNKELSVDWEATANKLRGEVLELRKELEG